MFDLRKLVGRVDKRACSMLLCGLDDERRISQPRRITISQRETRQTIDRNGRIRTPIKPSHKRAHAIVIFFFFLFKGVRLNPFEPSRPKSQSWNRVQPRALVAYEAEMPSFRLRERRCPLLWRGRSPDQVYFCSLGWPDGTVYYIKEGLSPLRC